MAFLKYRGGAIPTVAWTVNSAANAPLNNTDIDTNFYSLNAQKLDIAGGTITGSLTVQGDLTVAGTTTVNSTTITVDDKNIELGSVASPTDALANGGGITLKGTTDKTFNWVDATDSWTSSEHLAVAAGKTLRVNGSTSGVAIITVAATAGNPTLTLPTTSGTLALTSQLPTVNDASLTLTIGAAGTSNTTVTIGTGTGFTANDAVNATYDIKVGPALTNLATLMATAGAGFIRRGSTADTYAIDTNTYSLSSHGHSYYIGTTAVQTSSANQAITGITSITGGSGNTNVLLTSANNAGSTGEIRLKSGAVSVASGASGAVEIESGTTNGTSAEGGGSGLVRLTSGNSGTNGGAGSIVLAAGITNGTAINAGSISIWGGNTASSNSTSSNGNIYIAAGSPTFATGNKYGGRVYIDGGRPSAGGTIIDDGQVYIGTKSTVGDAGTIVIGIGNSSSTTTITGTVKLPTVGSSGFVKLDTGGQLTQDTTTYLSGTVPIANGGTNITTYAAGDILYASSANVLSRLAKGSDGQVLELSSGVPTWTTSVNGASIADDGSTASDSFYPTMTYATTSGAPATLYVSSSKYYFNPNTGTLNSISFNSLSDIRYKADLVKISGALNKVKELTGYTFKLIESDTRSAGLVAQEVNQVLPEAIGGTEDRLTVSYGALMGLIVEAIKELDEKLTNIQNQLSNK